MMLSATCQRQLSFLYWKDVTQFYCAYNKHPDGTSTLGQMEMGCNSTGDVCRVTLRRHVGHSCSRSSPSSHTAQDGRTQRRLLSEQLTWMTYFQSIRRCTRHFAIAVSLYLTSHIIYPVFQRQLLLTVKSFIIPDMTFIGYSRSYTHPSVQLPQKQHGHRMELSSSWYRSSGVFTISVRKGEGSVGVEGGGVWWRKKTFSLK